MSCGACVNIRDHSHMHDLNSFLLLFIGVQMDLRLNQLVIYLFKH